MKSRTTGLRVAGTLFAIFCLAHLWRLLAGVEVVVRGQRLPLAVSVAGALLGAALSFWMFFLAFTTRD